MTFAKTYFGVSIGDGPERSLATSECGPKLFLRKSAAMRWRRELQEHLVERCRVVSLACEFAIIESKKRSKSKPH